MKEELDRIAQRRKEWGELLTQEINRAGPTTYTRFLRERSLQWAAKPALIFGKRQLTYEDLWSRVDRARMALHNKGVKPGQVVALLMTNSDHYVVWYLAVLGMGAIAVPLNNRLVAREAAYILNHSESKLLLTEPEFEQLLRDVVRHHGVEIPKIILDCADEQSGLAGAGYQLEPLVEFGAPAALYYTSGTTGQPKGVIHTHQSLIADALQSPQAWEYDFDGVRSLAITPLFHIASHTIFFPVLFLGGVLVVDSYGTQSTIELIREQEINAFFAVPSILLLMVDKAKSMGVTLTSMRTLMFGAAPMTISKLADVQSLFSNARLIHGMGQTESGGTLVTLPSVAATAHAGSVGFAMAGVEVAIFNERDEQVPAGQVGELVARGPNVMQGYFRDEKATRDTLRNGWLHTGDLGYLDAEGLVTLVDRKKDMIIRGGENIYSSEVEQILLKHPAVKVAAVVGQPDSLFGEQVAAFLVTDPDLPVLTVDALVEHCRRYLADFKVPVTFRFLSEMPLTATGKIKKGDLRLTLSNYQSEKR